MAGSQPAKGSAKTRKQDSRVALTHLESDARLLKLRCQKSLEHHSQHENVSVASHTSRSIFRLFTLPGHYLAYGYKTLSKALSTASPVSMCVISSLRVIHFATSRNHFGTSPGTSAYVELPDNSHNCHFQTCSQDSSRRKLAFTQHSLGQTFLAKSKASGFGKNPLGLSH